MSFKYINPGYAGLLRSNYPTYKADVEATGKSKTGRAFTNTCFNLFPIPKTLTNDEIWLKCNAYLPADSNSYLYIGNAYSKDTLYNGLYFNVSESYVSLAFRYQNNARSLLTGYSYAIDIPAETGLKIGCINSIWLHLKYGEIGTGFLEFQINNKRFDKIQDVAFRAAGDNTYGVRASQNTVVFSNIIVSDEYVDPYEEIIELPISSTASDMSFDSETGIYTATVANQTLMSEVNTDNAINEYGSDSTITGIALIGNPAYEIDDVVTNLTSLIKNKGNVTEQ